MPRGSHRNVPPTGPAGGALVALGLALFATGCSDGTLGPPAGELPDGTYTVTLAEPIIVEPLVTPSWMGRGLSIDFTKAGDVLTVTGSTDDLVVLGPSLGFTPGSESASALFSWQEVDDGEHYWEVELTADECLVGKAVDADLGYGPLGVWTVRMARCSLERR